MKTRNAHVEIICPCCRRTQSIAVNFTDFMEWQKGALVQEAFPYLNANEREAFITGICPNCWEKLFSEEEDSEEDF